MDEQQLFLKKKQIFMQAVLQAVANGLKNCDEITEDQFRVILAEFGNTDITKDNRGTIDYMVHNGGYRAILFSKSFLTAFFGQYWWEHACQIIKLDEPLLYLEKYLKPIEQKDEWK